MEYRNEWEFEHFNDFYSRAFNKITTFTDEDKLRDFINVNKQFTGIYSGDQEHRNLQMSQEKWMELTHKTRVLFCVTNDQTHADLVR
jgi:hypothetical protein